MRIAIDAMGGDFAPGSPVQGAVAAARESGSQVLLVGCRAAIGRELARLDVAGLDIEVVDAPEAVGMDEGGTTIARRQRLTSIRLAVDAVARGDAAAVLTAGHTGAAVMTTHSALGLLPGVERSALAAALPTLTGMAVLVDAGANVRCRPTHLVQFAVMASVYATVAFDIARPRIGLLSIGEEEGKGNDLTRETHQRLKAGALPFVGNIEAHDIFSGRADVIVCEGFTGNIALKVSEGLAEAARTLLDRELAQSTAGRVGAALSRPAFDRLWRRMDPSEYGAAPLVGVAGLALVGHGRSSPRAVQTAIRLAERLDEANFVTLLAREIAGAPVSS
ncbi:MAG: phosphate acyltransferase PlsX [Luteitalea sp.]|nr:phosphate acyltransferase PlsX [Luteitalea sp.]